MGIPGLRRVLSVQSHVVSGYVGNKCAVLPLNLLGIEVDPILSVHFSNHTGYPSMTGTVMDGAQLAEVVKGLEDNDLLRHSHLLTGYIGSVTFLNQVAEIHRKLKTINPDLMYGALCLLIPFLPPSHPQRTHSTPLR